jgi:hypothetical protein
MSRTVTNTVDIRAEQDDVWAVLADLPATRWWLPGVVAARVDGDVRVCTMADGQEIHERISDLSAEARGYRFEHLRVPLPVRQLHGTFTVTPGSALGTSRVTLRTTFDPLDPTSAEEVTGMVAQAFRAVAGVVAPLRGAEVALGRVAAPVLIRPGPANDAPGRTGPAEPRTTRPAPRW